MCQTRPPARYPSRVPGRSKLYREAHVSIGCFLQHETEFPTNGVQPMRDAQERRRRKLCLNGFLKLRIRLDVHAARRLVL